MPAIVINLRAYRLQQRIMAAALLLGLAFLCLPAAAVAQQTAEDPRYKLASGDQIRVTIYNEDDLSRETTVDDRGQITFPFLGAIEAAGMTPGELESYIAEGLEGDYLIHPKVSVDIVQYRLFFVNGEVGSPGGFPFQPGITVRKAISVAGGFKERASEDKIYVIRDGNDGRPVRVRLDEQVRPGDIITVEQSFF